MPAGPAADAGIDAAVSVDAAISGEDPPPDEPPPETSLEDRCLTGSPCNRPVLPHQPEVPFLGETDDGWMRLIEADWELGPLTEGYRCVALTVPKDVYITAYSPLIPTGTHHTVLMVSKRPLRPDGVTVCGVSTEGERRLQGAGAGTKPSSVLPDGVAMRVSKGEQLMMNLHLFNSTDEVMRGTSGMRVKAIAKDQVKFESEVRLIGPLNISLPPHQEVVQRGGCALSAPATLYSVGPHMHQLGVHAKVTARSSIAGTKVLHDAEYDFNHQLIYEIEELPMAAGDYIEIECTYRNTTDKLVLWGDSSLAEMCFVGVGIYPSTDSGGFPCFQ